MRSLVRARSSHARAADDIRERRLAECKRAVEEFVVGLALIMAGHDPDLDQCASRSVVGRIRVALEPLFDRDELVRPDFGAHGELRIDGDLLDLAHPVNAWVEFDDRSMLQVGSRRIAPQRRRVRLHLALSLQPCQVIDVTVHLDTAE